MRSQGEDHDNSALRVKLTSGIFLYNCDTSSREGNLGPLIRLDAENLGTVIHATRFQHGSISYSRIRSPEKNSYAGLAVSLHLL